METITKTKDQLKEAVQYQKEFFQLPKTGDIIKGTVLGKESGTLYVDLGIIGTGIVYGSEYFRAQDEIKNIKPGDEISAKIVEMENDEGFRELSLKKAAEEKSWNYLQERMENKETIEVKITDANKGGLMAKIGSMTGFLPVSQLSPQNYPRVEGGDKQKILTELRKFVGTTLRTHILDLNPRENKLILSEKEAEGDTIKEALVKYKVGDVVKGEITGVVEFGAFIKFDPLLEGLIHISELDWSLVEDPGEVVKVGDKIEAKIVDIADDGRVSLSLKALGDDPWAGIDKKYKEGDGVEGEIAKINAYGALVKLDKGIQGLVHISEFEDEEELKEALEEGKKYKFSISSIDAEEHKIALKLEK